MEINTNAVVRLATFKCTAVEQNAFVNLKACSDPTANAKK